MRRTLIAILVGLSLPVHVEPVGAATPPSTAMEAVVQLEPGVSIAAIDARYGTRVLETLPDGYYRLALPAHSNAGREIRALDQNPDVAEAEPNFTLSERFRRYFVENGSEINPGVEPFIGQYQDQWASTAIGLPAALGQSSGQGIMVAVIDTAVDERHPILGHSVEPGISTVGAGRSSYHSGGAPHGTFVAGLIHLVAPDATILPIEALDAQGTGDVWDVAQAVRLAADRGAQVINLSLGTPNEAAVLDDAIAYAQDKGALVVASAGNDGAVGVPHFPSDLPGVVSVAALDTNLVKADFSNYGPHVVVSAPGVDTLSTFPTGGYAVASGTSMATAFVSGVAALVLAAHPGIDAWTAQSIISNTADDISGGNDPAISGLLGAGLIDAAAAVKIQPGSDSTGTTSEGGDGSGVQGIVDAAPSSTPGLDNPATAMPTDTDVAAADSPTGVPPTDVAPAATPTDVVPTYVVPVTTDTVPLDTAVATVTDSIPSPTTVAASPTAVPDTPTDTVPIPTGAVVTPVAATVTSVPVGAAQARAAAGR